MRHYTWAHNRSGLMDGTESELKPWPARRIGHGGDASAYSGATRQAAGGADGIIVAAESYKLTVPDPNESPDSVPQP